MECRSIPLRIDTPAQSLDHGGDGRVHPSDHLDHVLIWNAIDLKRKLEELRIYYNESRVRQSLNGSTPEEISGRPPPARAVLDHYAWPHPCRGLFQMLIAA